MGGRIPPTPFLALIFASYLHSSLLSTVHVSGTGGKGSGDEKEELDEDFFRRHFQAMAERRNRTANAIVSQEGNTVHLPCLVTNIGDATVTWMKSGVYDLLTVGHATYVHDPRIRPVHTRHTKEWALEIRGVVTEDSGLYECQLSSHPPISYRVTLRVVRAKTEIVGAPELYVKSGSELRLECAIRNNTEKPAYVFWYQGADGDGLVNHQVSRGVRVENDEHSSVLHVPRVTSSDGGNYTCLPSNAPPASVLVHVLKGENPAAVQQGNGCFSIPFKWLPLSSSLLALSLTRSLLIFR